MKTDKLKELDTAALQTTYKSIKVIAGLFAGILIVLFVVAIYLTFKKGFTPLIVVPIALMPILIIKVINIKNIKAELQSRQD
jgi:Na+-transporting methylmalonyl-CoA/oxaloacetate decarboxylase beta subunit